MKAFSASLSDFVMKFPFLLSCHFIFVHMEIAFPRRNFSVSAHVDVCLCQPTEINSTFDLNEHHLSHKRICEMEKSKT